ncbi:hypothetical protein Pmani_028206 [Petrolisthes manimaculis]|uniref:C-type lectin domain-containing protein n=1 Tax=Petrolisthes manimaculis TaxID=1843537 RepID=A0AAE1TY78_9EUCA|nr:hypothetical protein Pmani_028206 [Petrolisthes manimaculis]
MDVSRMKNKYLYLTLILFSLIVIIIVILATYTRPNMCSDKCKQDLGPNFHYDGREFHVQALLPLPWEKAQEWCEERESNLVKLPPDNYQHILHEIVSRVPVQYKPRIWLGATYSETRRIWKWVLGTEDHHENNSWPIPPINTTEKLCLDIYFESDQQMSFGYHSCELYQPFVCEFVCDPR